MKIKLPQVTLIGVDCVNVERLQVAMDVSEKNIEFGAVKILTSLQTEDPRLVKIPHIGSIEGFSVFCIKDLINYVDTEYVLLIQYDGFILNPESWTSEFLEYDYIGAPLSWGQKKVEGVPLEFIVGNGGFCLRSKKFLEASARFANEGKITRFDPEDAALCVWYRDLFEKEGLRYAPTDLSMKFSVVEDYGVYDKPFGFHGLFNKNMDSLKSNHPDFPMHYFLPRMMEKRYEKIQQVFEGVILEGHTFGSVVKTDSYISANVWLTCKDEDFTSIVEKRFEYYAKIGDVLYSEESLEKIGDGVFTFVVYKTRVGLLQVNFYLCPESLSFKTMERGELFGRNDLPFASDDQEKELAEIQDFIEITQKTYFH